LATPSKTLAWYTSQFKYYPSDLQSAWQSARLTRSKEKQLRGGLVFKTRRLFVSLTSWPRVIKKKKEKKRAAHSTDFEAFVQLQTPAIYLHTYIYIYIYIYTHIYIYIYVYIYMYAQTPFVQTQTPAFVQPPTPAFVGGFRSTPNP